MFKRASKDAWNLTKITAMLACSSWPARWLAPKTSAAAKIFYVPCTIATRNRGIRP